MASHAHSTRTPLLPQSGNPRPLLGQGLGRQLGPVSRAIRACRETDPADQAIAAIKDGLASFFAETNAVKSGISEPTKVGRESPTFDRGTFTHGIRALSRDEVENLVEGLVDLLDAWDGDADREPEALDASATEWTGRGAHRFNVGRAA